MGETAARSIRILVVDDHTVVRAGLCGMLELASDLEVIGEAANGREAVVRCAELQPDLVLMDLRMPEMDGLEAIRQIKAQWPKVEVVILTTYNEDDYIIQGLRLGARGYLLKDTSREQLYNAIRTASRGGSLLPPEILAKVVAHLDDSRTAAPAKPPVTSSDDSLLSQRECEVLLGVARGERNKEIAARLGISERTVKAHVASVYAKLGATARGEAIAIAMRKGIISSS